MVKDVFNTKHGTNITPNTLAKLTGKFFFLTGKYIFIYMKIDQAGSG